MYSGNFAVLPPTRSKKSSIPVKCFEKDHSVVLFWSITSLTQSLSGGNSWWSHSKAHCLLYTLSFRTWVFLTAWSPGQGFQCHLNISASATSPEAVGKNWVSCNQKWRLWNNFLYTTSPSPSHWKRSFLFSLPPSLSLSLSPSAASGVSYTYTLANTQYYCNMFDMTV